MTGKMSGYESPSTADINADVHVSLDIQDSICQSIAHFLLEKIEIIHFGILRDQDKY